MKIKQRDSVRLISNIYNNKSSKNNSLCFDFSEKNEVCSSPKLNLIFTCVKNIIYDIDINSFRVYINRHEKKKKKCNSY